MNATYVVIPNRLSFFLMQPWIEAPLSDKSVPATYYSAIWHPAMNFLRKCIWIEKRKFPTPWWKAKHWAWFDRLAGPVTVSSQRVLIEYKGQFKVHHAILTYYTYYNPYRPARHAVH